MRRKDREVTNIIEILQIIEKAKVLHLALFDADYPYIVPLHYGYEYKEGILIFYMHCAKEGHKLDLIRSNPNVCIEVESDVELISGGDVACKYGASFASVIGRGRAELTEDVQEKIRGLSLFMKIRRAVNSISMKRWHRQRSSKLLSQSSLPNQDRKLNSMSFTFMLII